MGIVLAIVLAVACFAGLWLSRRCTRPALEVCFAAILLGLAGYAWQGSPDMPGNPVQSRTTP